MPALKIKLAVLIVVALGVGSIPVLAQEAGDGLTTREQREQIQAEQVAAAEKLDAALAEDEALETALEQLDANVDLKREQAESAARALAAARREVAAAETRIEVIEVEIDAVRAEANRSAVVAYIESSGVRLSDLFSANNLNDLESKQALGANLRRSHTDAVDELRIKEEFLAIERDALVNAEQQLEGRKATQETRLRRVEQALSSREVLRAKLALRIEDFQTEVDALDAQESRLAELIRSEDAAIIALAEEEARRREAEAQAQREAAAAAAQAVVANDSGGSSSSETPLVSVSSGSGMQWPVFGARVTSEYGPRWGRMHQGIDIAAPTGTEIYAADGGTVLTARWYGGYGNAVIIDHGNGFVTLYGHMTHDNVDEGQGVSKGDLIGWMGCTGSCTGPHTHFETRVNGTAHDPRAYLP